MEARSCNHYCCVKAIRITYSECMSIAVGIQHAKRMRTILLSPVSRPAVLYFEILLHKGAILGKELLDVKSVFSFSLQL